MVQPLACAFAILLALAAGDTTGFLNRAQDGKDGALGALLERLRPRLVLWVSARLAPPLRAKLEPEDIAQEVLVSIYNGFQAFEGREPRPFFGWVFTIAENCIKDMGKYFGAQKRQRPEPRSFSQTSPSQAAARKDEIARMQSALERLPDRFRDIIRLRVLEEADYEECGRRLERSPAACRTLLTRALAALRDELSTGHE